MPAQFFVEIKGLNQFITAQIKLVGQISERQISQIAQASSEAMRENIRISIQRPGSSGDLERAIFAQPLNDGKGSWGVGFIDYMNKAVPYWRWINFGIAGTGRTTPPASLGSFSPGQERPSAGAFRSGRFQKDGLFLVQPKRPIQPHNYIQRTLQQQKEIIASVLGLQG